MNIEQVKKDLDNGIIVSPITYRKLVEAALLLQQAAMDVGHDDVLDAVEAL